MRPELIQIWDEGAPTTAGQPSAFLSSTGSAGEALPPRVPGVYVIVNNRNENYYVGSTVNLRKRWVLHRHLLRMGRHHSPHLQNAWGFYGEPSFSFLVLAHVYNKQLRMAIEQTFLDLRPKYNVALKAVSSAGVVRSEETKEKLRQVWNAPGYREKVMAARSSRPLSEEHKALIAEAHKGKVASEEAREAMRRGSARRWAREEERAKAREAAQNRRK
jgi:group I intron endonuclease